MNLNFILFVLIPFVLMLAVSVGLPLWKNKIIKEAGQKILTTVTRKSKLTLISVPLAFLLLFLSTFFDFGKMNFVVPYCAVLGLFAAVKESTLLPVNGLYENLIINGSTIIKYEDIASLAPNSAAQNTITITTRQKRQLQLVFDNPNETSEVLSALKKKV